MKAQKQRGNECILATIAALTDRPLSRIRKVAAPLITPFPTWGALLRASCRDFKAYQLAWYAIKIVAEKHKLPFALFIPGPSSSSMRLPLFEEADRSRVIYRADLPEEGRGVADLTTIGILPRIRHMVAFEDGLIYDSNAPGPGLPLNLVLEAYDYERPHAKIVLETVKVLRTNDTV